MFEHKVEPSFGVTFESACSEIRNDDGAGGGIQCGGIDVEVFRCDLAKFNRKFVLILVLGAGLRRQEEA
jgi:hypothetical protein